MIRSSSRWQNRLKHRMVFFLAGLMMVVSVMLNAEEAKAPKQAEEDLLGMVRGQLPALSSLVDTSQVPKQNPEQIRNLIMQLQQEQSQAAGKAENNSPNPNLATGTPVQPGSSVDQNAEVRALPPQSAPVGVSSSAGGNKAKPNMEVSEEAFAKTLLGAMPLTPEQIVTLRHAYNLSQLAAVTSPSAPPTPVATTQEVNLAPGATPPVIRLLQGFVTSVVFVDQSGSPWPIVAYDLGDPAVFNVQWDTKSNILLIQAQKLFSYGNLAVLLNNLNTPVMVTLIPGQREVDYRADLRIPGFGPNAKYVPISGGLPQGANQVLLDILNGLSPEGGQSLHVDGCDCQAWQLGNKMYLRTRVPVIAPGWLGVMESPDGTKAYEIQKSPRILVSKNGKITSVQIEGLRESG